jgi:hypothetical protein
VVFSGNIEDGQLQVGKFFITLPNKTVLQTIEGTFNVTLLPTSPASLSLENSREESKGQDLEIKKLSSVEAKVDLPINLSNALNSNLERLASEGI